MDFISLSTSLSQANLANEVGVAMLSKALDTNESMGASMIEMLDRSMELSVNPHIGSNFDVSV